MPQSIAERIPAALWAAQCLAMIGCVVEVPPEASFDPPPPLEPVREWCSPFVDATDWFDGPALERIPGEALYCGGGVLVGLQSRRLALYMETAPGAGDYEHVYFHREDVHFAAVMGDRLVTVAEAESVPADVLSTQRIDTQARIVGPKTTIETAPHSYPPEFFVSDRWLAYNGLNGHHLYRMDETNTMVAAGPLQVTGAGLRGFSHADGILWILTDTALATVNSETLETVDEAPIDAHFLLTAEGLAITAGLQWEQWRLGDGNVLERLFTAELTEPPDAQVALDNLRIATFWESRATVMDLSRQPPALSPARLRMRVLDRVPGSHGVFRILPGATGREEMNVVATICAAPDLDQRTVVKNLDLELLIQVGDTCYAVDTSRIMHSWSPAPDTHWIHRWSVQTEVAAQSLLRWGDYIYVIGEIVQIFHLRDPQSQIDEGFVSGSEGAMDAVIHDDELFVATANGVAVYSMSQPWDPIPLRRIGTAPVLGLASHRGALYLLREERLEMTTTVGAAVPTLISVLPPDSGRKLYLLEDDTLYLSGADVPILDVSDPLRPVPLPGVRGFPRSVPLHRNGLFTYNGNAVIWQESLSASAVDPAYQPYVYAEFGSDVRGMWRLGNTLAVATEDGKVHSLGIVCTD